MYQWIEQCLKSEYQFVRAIGDTEEKRTLVMKNRKMGQKILVKYFTGSAEVYQYLMQVRIPGIPQIYEVAQDKDRVLVLEEYVEGITMQEVLESGLYHRRGVKNILSQLCDMVASLHENGIVHRDIKPENIIIENQGLSFCPPVRLRVHAVNI